MTKGERATWPGSLQQLVSDTSYMLSTNEVIHTYRNGSREIVPFFEYFFSTEIFLNGTPGKDYPIQFIQ